MFEIGDLVTVLSATFAHYVQAHTYEQWITNPYGIVVAVEPLDDSIVVLVKVHFASLGGSYWLRAHEVMHVIPQLSENK